MNNIHTGAEPSPDVRDELLAALADVKLLREACHRYLRDPECPERYDIGPRATDITVVYRRVDGESASGRLTRDRLPVLLERVGMGTDVEHIELRHADPRELLLKACAETRRIADAIAKVMPPLTEVKRMEELRDEILSAVAEASPEVRDAVVARLRFRPLHGRTDGGTGTTLES